MAGASLAREAKRCYACKRELPASEFYKGTADCKPCSLARQKARRATESGRKAAADYEAKQRTKPGFRARVNAWRKTLRGRLSQRLAQQKRRAQIKATYALTVAEWQNLLERCSYRCSYCGRSDVPMTIDHIVPISKGGTHELANVTPACSSHNSSRGAKRLVDFLFKPK